MPHHRGIVADRFAELKARQALTWGAAPFERITETFGDIHDRLIARLEPRPGEEWLDVATGTGPLALRASRAGATVTGLDLAPALIATARRLAAAEGRPIRYEVGDCERLPYPAASFDVVVSSFGVIFAPDHAAVAAELARVCRPGGRLGLAGWQPGGGAARMTEVVVSFQPGPPVPGAGNPFDWGREEYVRQRLGDAFELEFVSGNSPQVAPSAEAVWELYVTSAGPVKVLAGNLDPERREQFHRAFVSLVDRHHAGDGIRFPREYRLVFGRHRDPMRRTRGAQPPS
jgi:SAM-dependent methyltransferase